MTVVDRPACRMSDRIRGKRLRCVVALAALSLAGGVIAGPSAASTAGLPPQATAPAPAVPAVAVAGSDVESAGGPEPSDVRVKGRTTRRSRTWRRPDGTLRSRIYASPVNYRDERGEWQDIDSTLVESTKAGVAAQNAANDFEVRLPQNAAAEPVRYTDRDGEWVSFQLAGLKGQPSLSGSKATYGDVADADRVTYEVTATGLKESVVLTSAPAQPVSYRYSLATSGGVRPVLRESGEIDFLDADDAVAFTMPAPFMVDSADPEPVVSTDVDYRFESAGDEWTLVVEPSASWLSDPARVFPVVIDPSVHQGDTVRDCWINEASPTASNCGSANTSFRVGVDNGKRRRGLLKFSIGAIPSSAVVLEADAMLYLRGGQATSSLVDDYKLRQFETASSAGWGNAATWIKRTANYQWTNPGAWSDTLNSNVDSRTMGGGNAGYKAFDATSIVENWLGGDNNRGVMVNQIGGDTENVLMFASSDASDSSKRPYLEVTYNLPPGEPVTSIDPCLGACDETGRTTDTVTPTLQATATDTDNTDLDYTFTVTDPATSTTLATSPPVTVPEGQQAEWEVPSGTLSDGGSYEFFVEVDDGDTTVAADPLAFDVDVDQPPTEPADVTLGPCVPNDCSAPLTTDSLTPDLSATAADPDSAQVSVDFEVREAGNGTVLATGADGPFASGGTGTWTVPAGTLAAQGSYEFRIGARDATSTTWAPWQAFDVDVDEAPSAPSDLALTPCPGGCSGWVTDTATPTFRATSSDADTNALDYTFEVQTPGGQAVTAGTVEAVEQGTTASWLVPVGAIPEEGDYELRVGATDGTTTTWSTWTDVEVDLPASTPTPLTGHSLTADETWTAAGSPYILSGAVTVPEGRTLTMEPGTVVKFDSDSAEIEVAGGELDARGVANRPVVLTSAKDDILGDTDGDNGDPAPGDYDTGLYFKGALAGPTPVSTLRNVSMRYGGTGSEYCSDAAIKVGWSGGRLEIEDSELTDYAPGAIALYEGGVTVRNSYFAAGRCGIRAFQDNSELAVFESVFADGNFKGGVRLDEGPTRVEGSWFLGDSAPEFQVNRDLTREEADFFHNAFIDLEPDGNHEDLTQNWWGRVLPEVTFGCGKSDTYPALNWHTFSSECWDAGQGQYEYDDYYAPIYPGMDEAPPFPEAGLAVLSIDYDGDLLPPLVPVEQTWGCSCYFHGADATNHVADPVATNTSEMMETATDLRAEAPGLPMEFTRTYNGADSREGPLGVGWTHSYDTGLGVDQATGDVTFRDPTGGRLVFGLKPDGSYLPDAGGQAVSLEANQGGGWTLTSTQGEVWTFNSDGLLVSDVDAAGQGVSLGYSGAGASARLTSITDAAGQVTTLGYGSSGAADGRVTSVETDDGRSVGYGYGTVAGGVRLTSVTDPTGETTTFGYDTDTGKLDAMTDPLGHTSAQNVYDPITGRLTEQTNAAGETTYFEWTPSSDPAAPEGTGVQRVYDSEHVLVNLDAYYGHVLLAHAKGYREATRYGYDGEMNLVSVADPRGNVTTMTYDADGNMLTRTAPAPVSTTESWTYDVHGNVTSYTDGAGDTTSYTYNGAQRLVTVTDPMGGETAFTYTAAGRVQTSTTPEGRQTVYAYDAAGNLTNETTPEGRETVFGFDAAGNLTSVVDPRGNAAGATAADYTTTYTYDDQGRELTATDPDGTVTEHTYDAAGQPTRTTITDATEEVLADTSHTYDPMGRLLTTKEFSRTTQTNTYDLRGRLASSTDAEGGTTTYEYNAANRVDSMATPRANEAGADPGDYTWDYRYDEAGNLTGVYDSAWRRTGTSYDALSRPVEKTTPLGHTTSIGYDDAGRVAARTDPLGHQTSYTYDDNGRLTGQSLPGQDPTTYTYDDDGHRLSQTSPSGNSTTTYTHDDDGRPVSEVGPRGNQPGATPADHTTTHSYDPAGNLLSSTDPLGHTTAWTYDAAGNQLTETNPGGHTTTREYDALGQLTSVLPPSGSGPGAEPTTYTYNQYGDATSVTDGNDHTTSYEYNKRHQVTSITDPLDREWTYQYDAEGNLKAYYTARAHEPGADPEDYGIWQHYDQRGLLTGRQAPNDGSATAWFDYDDDGQLSWMGDGEGVTTYDYDDAGRLTDIATPSGDWAYTYNPAGQITGRDYPQQADVTYTYNDDGLPETLTANGATTSLGYNPDQQLTQLAYPAGVGHQETRTYDATGQIATVQTKDPAAANPLSRVEYTRNALGNPTRITTTRGTTSTEAAYTYNARGWLTGHCPEAATCVGATDRTTYTYDQVGNRTQQQHLGASGPGTTDYTYDDADQLTSSTDGTSTETYTYDADGHPTTNGETWNALGQLTSTTTGPDTTTFAYDGRGNRREITTDDGTSSETTQLQWDINNPLPMIGVITDPGNDHTAQLHAPDGTLIAARHDTKAYTYDYYGHDALGSITDAITGAGTPTQEHTYDPWGAQTSNTLTGNAIDTPFGYTGEYTEPATGQVHLRARDYNPTTGRFTTTDPLPQPPTQPRLTDYHYTANQPLLHTDHTGLCRGPDWICGAAKTGGKVTVGIGGGLARIGEMIAAPQSLTNQIVYGQESLTDKYYYGATHWAFGVDGTETSTRAGEWVSPLPGAAAAGAFCKVTSKVGTRILPRIARPSGPAANAGAHALPIGPGSQKAWTVLNRIDAKGAPLPGYKGGSIFKNKDGVLPETPGVTYREWDVNPYTKGVDRGVERIVTGSDGSAFWTGDHYDTFLMFRGPTG